METTARVTTGADLPCEVELEAGGRTGKVVFDHAGELSDGEAGPSSTQAVSAALAACTAVTLRIYAERKGWSLDGLEVEVATTYDGPNPSLFTVKLGWPEHLGPEQVERLERIAGKCPVHRLVTEATTVELESA